MHGQQSRAPRRLPCFKLAILPCRNGAQEYPGAGPYETARLPSFRTRTLGSLPSVSVVMRPPSRGSPRMCRESGGASDTSSPPKTQWAARASKAARLASARQPRERPWGLRTVARPMTGHRLSLVQLGRPLRPQDFIRQASATRGSTCRTRSPARRPRPCTGLGA